MQDHHDHLYVLEYSTFWLNGISGNICHRDTVLGKKKKNSICAILCEAKPHHCIGLPSWIHSLCSHLTSSFTSAWTCPYIYHQV